MATQLLRSRLLHTSRALGPVRGLCHLSESTRPGATPSNSRHLVTATFGQRPVVAPFRANQTRRSLVASAVAGMVVPPAPVPKVLFEPESLVTVKVDTDAPANSWDGELLIITVSEDDVKTADGVTSLVSEELKAIDTASAGAISDIISAGGFEGKQGQQSKAVRVGSAPGLKAKSVALVGVGKKLATTADWGASPAQALGTAVAALAKTVRVSSAGILLLQGPCTADTISYLATGVMTGGWEGSRFKSKPSPTASKLKEVHVLPRDSLAGAANADLKSQQSALQGAVNKAHAIAAGVYVTRYLVEAPPNICTPSHLADAAKHIAEIAPSTMKLTVFDAAQCREMNMGCYLGVAEASEHPPKFIHLTYTSPGDGPKKKVALIGKGLTFDSGGYNIKAGAGSMIELMKFDMGGAGATIGAARIIAGISPPGLEVHFIVAACENMVAGKGLRPGDILTSASGKTVEVNNTDAEGRLTLADAMWFAQEKCGVKTMVDSATLTGACIVGLGTEVAGLFTPSDSLSGNLIDASKAAGEKLWRMPMEATYWDAFKSSCADMKNTGSRWGGAIGAALFLKQFVNEGVDWAHIDLAGPVWDEKAGLPTGYGASTLAHFAIAQGQTEAK